MQAPPSWGATSMSARSCAVGARAVVLASCAMLLAGGIWKTPGLGSGLLSALIATFVMVSPGIAALLYLTPTIVAQRRDHPQKRALVAVNLFFGWTFAGWALALGWSIVPRRSPGLAGRSPVGIREAAAVKDGDDRVLRRPT